MTTHNQEKEPATMNSTPSLPAPTGPKHPTPRNRPYGYFVDRAFDRDTSTRQDRKIVRFLYRQFRKQLYASPFSARALCANYIMLAEWSLSEHRIIDPETQIPR